MSQLTNYIKDSYNELVTKVTWPTWRELQESSVLVFVASLLIAGVVFAMDWSFGVNRDDSPHPGFLKLIYDMNFSLNAIPAATWFLLGIIGSFLGYTRSWRKK